MKKYLIGLVVMMLMTVGLSYAGELDHIILYDTAIDSQMIGTGINGFKLVVGQEMTIVAKGVDKDGGDVPIWPTWKADKELSIKVVEGRSKTITVKAVKEGAPLFITATYIDDNGKTFKGEAMGSVKAAAK